MDVFGMRNMLYPGTVYMGPSWRERLGLGKASLKRRPVFRFSIVILLGF